ncbi:MAG: hypothetical protein ABIG56_02930 [Candidatus Omnitrophota bacterium]
MRRIRILALLWFFVFGLGLSLAAGEDKVSSIIVNGDEVEYMTESKEWIASGNVEVLYKGSRLTCDKLSVDTQAKVGFAEGNARLDDQRGIIEGEKIIYNFESKTGTIVDAEFRANPYFGRSTKVEKISETEFIAFGGYASTCSFDHPHYRLKSKQINIIPEDKIITKKTSFRWADYPLVYLPWYSHSLKDPFMHVRVVPGKTKDWGPYVLTAWRYNITDNINGRIYLDYRDLLGESEGFGLNYNTQLFGKGDLKYYYTQERSRRLAKTGLAEFQRYFIRLRHKWDIDEQTNFTSEFYRISDQKRKLIGPSENFLKDYFYREYEKDSEPLSYALLHRNFQYSSLDALIQKRVNHWFAHVEKLPEIKYSLPSLQVGESWFYFQNESSLANLNKKEATSSTVPDEENVVRLDTTNKFSLPARLAFFRLTPFIFSRQTIYDKGVDGILSTPVRTIFGSGIEVSTKFYRFFEVKSNFLGMEINRLRHIITPTISYAYNHEPTVVAGKLKQIDEIDSITRSNQATLELSNKLQTKRSGANVDLVDFIVKSDYIFKPKTGDKLGSNLGDIICELKFLPYSWLRIDSDATYKRSGNRSDENYNSFSNINYDIIFDFGNERSLGIGQRYQRKSGKEITNQLNWRLSPKWKVSTYQRYEFGNDPTLKRGLREQEYTITRDLHCWEMAVTYNVKRNEGESVFLIFRLKAFPEMEFGFDQSYHQPKTGSQSIP